MELNKKRRIKWFGLLQVLFITFLCSLNVFSDVNAVSLGYNFFSFNYNTPQSQSYVYSGHKGYDSATFNMYSINRIAASSTNVGSVPSNANYMTVTAKFNLLTWTDNGAVGYLPSSGSENPHISAVAINDSPVPFESSNLNVYITNFSCQPLNAGWTTNCRTFTYEFTFVVKNVSGTISSVSFAALYDGSLPLFSGFRDGYNAYFEYDPNNKVIVDFSYDYTSALLQQQTQLQSITNNNLTEINDTINEHYAQENEAYDSISGQSTSDIQGSTNQQTSNIIGVISRFFTSLSGISSQSCDLTLPFPQYAGGTVTVSPCNGKQYLPDNGLFINIAASLFLVGFTIPLCFILLKMIYNEIRSWTNG